jgi:uncharacterized DUF497 family protein
MSQSQDISGRLVLYEFRIAICVTSCYTERDPAIRIISARLATKREQEAYYHAEDY